MSLFEILRSLFIVVIVVLFVVLGFVYILCYTSGAGWTVGATGVVVVWDVCLLWLTPVGVSERYRWS